MAGRSTPKRTRGPDDALPPLRQRSPFAFWVAILVLAGMVAALLAGVVGGLAG